MASQPEQLQAAIAALEGQRHLLGDAVVDASIGALRSQLDALAAADAQLDPVQRLRQVTILFLDVVGSTTLARRLDPEEVNAVMDGALQRCTAIVRAHEGKVLQYAGDSLLAVFGAVLAREDDAERAVRCGLSLLAEGSAIGAEVGARHGHEGFDLRIGIHTGSVLLGGGVDADGSIRGIAVNVAARMEQTAPPGGLRVSQATWALVRGLFDAEAQPPIAVKGLDEPVSTWLVQRVRPRGWRIAARGVEGVVTRMIGRDAELRRLQQACLDLSATPRLALVTVVGAAGVGKTRLLREFEAWNESQPARARVARGRAYPATQGQPYGLLREIVAAAMRIAADDPPPVARRKLEAGVVPLFEAEVGAELAQAHAHVLGQLIGMDFGDSPHLRAIRDDARQVRARALHVVAQMLRRLAAGTTARPGAPVVLQLEDLHWADDGTLDFLQQMMHLDRDVPLLLVALARPELYERRPDWGAGIDGACRVDLGPLGAAASRSLADELLQRLDEVPHTLRERVAERAEGNPFFMEELVRMLIEQRAIVVDGERWRLHADRLRHTPLPPTLTGVLQARLDGLPRDDRIALQQASVIGPVFWDTGLAALDERAPLALPALQRRELAQSRAESALDGAREYAFGHQILHQVTYDTLLKRTRRALHARAAAWLAGLDGPRAADFLAATAEHHERAGHPAQACEYYARAAEHAQSRYAHDLALAHAMHGLALLDGDAADAPQAQSLRWRLLWVREFALNLQGRRSEQREALAALRGVADALDDDRRRSLAARRRSLFAMRTADHEAQAVAAREALDCARRAGDDESALEAQRLLADALAAQGDLDAAQALAQDGLARARGLGLRRVQAVFLNALSFIAGIRDDQVSGLAFDLQDLSIWRELGDPHGEALALGNVGADWLWFGEHDQARRHLERALQMLRAIGALPMLAAPLGNLSQVLLHQGDAEASLALARECAAIAVDSRAADFETDAFIRVADAELSLGRHADAAGHYAHAETLAQRIGYAAQRVATAGRARAALAAGDAGEALRLVEPLVALAREPAALDGGDGRIVLLSCHRVLEHAGDARAPQLLARAHESLQRRAATIADATLRDAFLQRVPENRDILAAWTRLQSGGPGAAPVTPG